jgi:endonuclease-8
MPEGHSLKRAAIMWNRNAGQLARVSSPQGRFAEDAALIDRRRFRKAWSHGKHLFLEFEPNYTVHIHLGLYGKHHQHLTPAPAPVGAVRMRIRFSNRTIDLNGPTKCEVLDDAGVQKVLDRLGPDPLKLDEAPASFIARVAKLKTPVGKLLMDQNEIAGIGNVYRAEILFMRGLSPFTPAKDISSAEWRSLWILTSELMTHGVEHSGGIETVYSGAPQPLGMPREIQAACAKRTYVYKRATQPCVLCGNPVKAETFHGRMLYWCPVDQPAPPVPAVEA